MLHPVIASREVTRYILDTFGLHTKKRFGQNFLINESVVRGIAEKAKIGPGDLVLEVGPVFVFLFLFFADFFFSV